jgi:hypothetical protein
MNYPAASYGVSNHHPHEASLTASFGELNPKEIRISNYGIGII